MKKYYKFLRKSLVELKKNDGFTLAEVLITLGIIGVVAAMTIPTLIANVQGQRVRSQFKKTLSTLNQAGRMAQAQYDWDFGAVEGAGGDNSCAADNPETTKTMCALLNGTLKGRSYNGVSNTYYKDNVTKLYSGFSNKSDMLASDYLVYQLTDSAIFGFYRGGSSGPVGNCTLPTGNVLNSTVLSTYGVVYGGSQGMQTRLGLKQCIGFIDVNGISLPNKEVTCADGSTVLDPQNPCVVSNKNLGDIIPVVFHDGVVEPATNAVKYLLNTAK
ncbi:type II secretion system protein [bacterium]|nr:type II secretion system protein [bacterium]